MSTQPNLRVRVSADINDIKQGLSLLRGEVARFKKEAEKSIDLRGLNDSVKGFATIMRGALAGVTVGSVLRGIIGETRAAGEEMAQLQAVVESTGKAAGFSAGELRKMAAEMSATTTHSEGDIIRAQTRLLSYTGIVGKQFPAALQITIDQSARLGESIELSAETVGKALDKPSQGVTALTKQGFKFTEAEKERMKVLEKSGRTGEAQKIVLDAMAESYAGAAAAARVTFGGALASVGNAVRTLFDGSGGGSLNGATKSLNQFADALRSPEMQKAFSDMVASVLKAVAGFASFMAQDGVRYLRLLAEAAAFAVKHVDVLAVALGTYLAARGVAAAIVGVQSIIKWLTGMRAALTASAIAANGLRATLATMGGPITLAITALTTALYYLYKRTQDAKEAAIAHKRALEEMTEVAKTSRDLALDMARAKREEALATLQAAKAALTAARYEAAATGFAAGGGGPLGMPRVQLGESDPRVTRAKAGAEAAQQMLDDIDEKMFELLTTGIEQILKPIDATGAAVEEGGKAIAKSNALLIDDITRTQAELSRLYAENSISIEDYFSRRIALQQRSIDLEIDQAQSELKLAKDAGARRKIEEQIAKLLRDRADVATTGANEQRKAEEALTKALRDVELQLMEMDGKGADAMRLRLLAEFDDTFAKLRANGKQAGIDMLNSLIDRKVAEAKAEELREVLSRATSTLQSTETSVGAQVSSGMLGYNEGERQLSEARAKALGELRALRVAQLEVMSGYAVGSAEHTAALAGLAEIDRNIAGIVASQDKWGQHTEDLATSAFGDFLADLTTGAKTFKEAFADMVKSFVAGVARMIAQEAALRTVRQLMGGWGRVGPVQRETIPVGSHHAGGIAGRATRRIRVSPLLFGAAPRYHSGGIAGLKPDEVPAILQTGERVLSRKQTAAYEAARGGFSKLRVEIENRGQPQQVTDASISRGSNGEGLLRLVLDAVADDMAAGGRVARAGAARYGWREQVG